MKIVVCIKQVARLADGFAFADEGADVRSTDIEYAPNEWDVCAVEEALLLREGLELPVEVIAISVGGDEVDSALRHALAMGADRAIRVVAGRDDPLSIARALARAIAPEKPDLILAGAQSSDSVQAAVGTLVAGLLGLPCVSVITSLQHDPGDSYAVVEREVEGGLKEAVEVDLPAVFTVQTGISQPRYVTLRARRRAAEGELNVHEEVKDDGLPAYRIRRMSLPAAGAEPERIEGSPDEIAGRIRTIIAEALR